MLIIILNEAVFCAGTILNQFSSLVIINVSSLSGFSIIDYLLYIVIEDNNIRMNKITIIFYLVSMLTLNI